MMTGLWGDTPEGAVSTAREIAALSPDCVRIYPTVVMKGTELEKRYLSGEYHPMELEQAVELCGDLLTFFHQQAIPVIRLGLHSSPELDQGRVAGPWHPAFRELCESRMLLRRITAFLQQGQIPRGMIQIAVAPSWVSRAVGQSRCNLASLGQMGYQARVIQDAAIAPSDFQIFCQTQPESR